MSHSIKFLLDNAVDTATLSSIPVSAMHATLPLANLKESSRSLVARSIDRSAGDTITIKGILTGSITADSFVIGNHNFNTGTGYRLDLYSDASFVTNIYTNSSAVSADFAAMPSDTFKYNIPIWFDQVYSGVQAFKLTLTNPAAEPMNYFQIGRLFLGNSLSTAIGASFGHSLYWNENTTQYRTEAGTLRSDIITPNKVIEFSLNTISESERSSVQRALANTGKRKDFFISLFSTSCDPNIQIDYSGIVKMTKVPRYAEFAPSFYSAKYTVEEI